jgi:hypothetical protein
MSEEDKSKFGGDSEPGVMDPGPQPKPEKPDPVPQPDDASKSGSG